MNRVASQDNYVGMNCYEYRGEFVSDCLRRFRFPGQFQNNSFRVGSRYLWERCSLFARTVFKPVNFVASTFVGLLNIYRIYLANVFLRFIDNVTRLQKFHCVMKLLTSWFPVYIFFDVKFIFQLYGFEIQLGRSFLTNKLLFINLLSFLPF